MTIEVELPDGSIVEFTDDTSQKTMEMALARYRQPNGSRTPRTAPDFSDVRSGSSTVQGVRPKFEPGSGLGSRITRNLGAAVGLGDETEQFALGLGRFIDRTYRGAKQLGADSLANQSGLLASGLESAGFDAAAGMLGRNVTAPLARVSERERQAERMDRQVPSAGPAMTAGEITSTVGSLVGPGALLRGTSAAPVFLPRTLLGNAVQGGVIGASQPVAEQGERGLNAGLGFGAGYVGAALPRAIGAAYRGVRGLLPNALTATDRAAGQALLNEAANPQALNFTPSAVPGSQRAIGEATLDPGLMALENTMRSQSPALFSQIDRANNAARMGLLGNIAGTDADMIAAEEARGAASGGLLNRVFAEGAQDELQRQGARALMAGGESGLSGLRSELAAISAAKGGNDAVQSALADVNRALAKASDTVGGLRNVRDYIGVLLSGKAGADKGYAKAASRELIRMREAIDAEIAARAPSHPDFLRAHQEASIPINRMQVGRELMDRGGATADAITGMRTMTPAQFSKAANDLDAVAAEATGFDKAKAADILTEQDLSAIRAIQDDLERQFTRANTRPTGVSPTFGLQEAGKRLALRSAARVVPGISGAVDFFEGQANQRLQQRLSYLVANPAEAQRVLQALKPKDRAAVASLLAQISARSGALYPALTE
jgi:hypothetical protein